MSGVIGNNKYIFILLNLITGRQNRRFRRFEVTKIDEGSESPHYRDAHAETDSEAHGEVVVAGALWAAVRTAARARAAASRTAARVAARAAAARSRAAARDRAACGGRLQHGTRLD